MQDLNYYLTVKAQARRFGLLQVKDNKEYIDRRLWGVHTDVVGETVGVVS